MKQYCTVHNVHVCLKIYGIVSESNYILYTYVHAGLLRKGERERYVYIIYVHVAHGLLTYSYVVIEVCLGFMIRLKFVTLIANIHPFVLHYALQGRQECCVIDVRGVVCERYRVI